MTESVDVPHRCRRTHRGSRTHFGREINGHIMTLTPASQPERYLYPSFVIYNKTSPFFTSFHQPPWFCSGKILISVLTTGQRAMEMEERRLGRKEDRRWSRKGHELIIIDNNCNLRRADMTAYLALHMLVPAEVCVVAAEIRQVVRPGVCHCHLGPQSLTRTKKRALLSDKLLTNISSCLRKNTAEERGGAPIIEAMNMGGTWTRKKKRNTTKRNSVKPIITTFMER